MHAMLEDIVHVAVLQAIADAAGMALRGALAAIGDADLPWLEGFPINPMIGGERRDRAQDRGPLIVIERSADMLLLGQQYVVFHVEDAGGVVGALEMQSEP